MVRQVKNIENKLINQNAKIEKINLKEIQKEKDDNLVDRIMQQILQIKWYICNKKIEKF